MRINEPDAKALKILRETYWSSKGWQESPQADPADFKYAKAQGLMFDPVRLTHDAIVKWAIASVAKVSRTEVADAFLASLTTGRLDLRSALGSYAATRHIAPHGFRKCVKFRGESGCAICGKPISSKSPEDLNVLNFERFKWGGVRHDEPQYAAFDLERLSETAIPKPTEADRQCLRKILAEAAGLPAKGRPSALEKAIAPHIKSSKSERQVLISILSLCGILQPKAVPGFFAAHVNFDDRAETNDDWHYPTGWWRGADGVERAAVKHWFPGL